jgi:hypothetical protein
MKPLDTKSIIIQKFIYMLETWHPIEITSRELSEEVQIRKASLFHHYPAMADIANEVVAFLIMNERDEELKMLRGQLLNCKKYKKAYEMIGRHYGN